jgi:tRNA A-37 threonylcarbamoyl transferase component Bud32
MGAVPPERPWLPPARARPYSDRVRDPAPAPIAGLPDRFDRYTVLGHLATGGMAEVYLARQAGPRGFEKLVVIKRIRPELVGEPGAVDAFLDEARLVATLEHPHIVQVLELGVVAGTPFFVMEHVGGVDLRQLLEAAVREGEEISLANALYIAIDVCAALHYAHERPGPDGAPLGIIHRDMSPSNVLISHDGAVKVCDFGIAKASSRTRETQRGVVKGKFSYMSPEQCTNAPLDRRSDVFALGILLYELTTQTHLFRAGNDYGAMKAIVEDEIPPPSARAPGYPPELEAIVLRALARDPAARYPTAEALQTALEDFAREHKLALSSTHVAALMRRLFLRRDTAQLFSRTGRLARLTAGPAAAGSADAIATAADAEPGAAEAGPAPQAEALLDVSTADAIAPAGWGVGAGPAGAGWLAAAAETDPGAPAAVRAARGAATIPLRPSAAPGAADGARPRPGGLAPEPIAAALDASTQVLSVRVLARAGARRAPRARRLAQPAVPRAPRPPRARGPVRCLAAAAAAGLVAAAATVAVQQSAASAAGARRARLALSAERLGASIHAAGAVALARAEAVAGVPAVRAAVAAGAEAGLAAVIDDTLGFAPRPGETLEVIAPARPGEVALSHVVLRRPAGGRAGAGHGAVATIAHRVAVRDRDLVVTASAALGESGARVTITSPVPLGGAHGELAADATHAVLVVGGLGGAGGARLQLVDGAAPTAALVQVVGGAVDLVVTPRPAEGPAWLRALRLASLALALALIAAYLARTQLRAVRRVAWPPALVRAAAP